METGYDRCPKAFLSAIALAAPVIYWLCVLTLWLHSSQRLRTFPLALHRDTLRAERGQGHRLFEVQQYHWQQLGYEGFLGYCGDGAPTEGRTDALLAKRHDRFAETAG